MFLYFIQKPIKGIIYDLIVFELGGWGKNIIYALNVWPPKLSF
jgi:hypothetical protein